MGGPSLYETHKTTDPQTRAERQPRTRAPKKAQINSSGVGEGLQEPGKGTARATKGA